ncbi:membrane-associated progesterone receptor component 1 [Copidosoma floridanum]|uniref:membrane-associated progesterone receptor component 1 n=1 Tax=Copidosoma floridanum TaxID=29053 RepID=UPI0006C9B1EB|nr:membrane-associated progesterone receptor component 1 [Copidosoma floridanum]XP_014214180.1 membrane-associated progesterone receptor component 1 [Copidosoma floridanum]XP_014214181.1 membrane-associated progesterone receptor component 1 [Copidosoma floridanum]XP_014214182.1 membrane-associated progesterone receptor component 1 [Copidosoma floridanum]XP_014214183.1 membrane-associated progesterone receptor component 1 [Copidosoma floridanum]XP_014214185.1 membrane-associated progesterone re
MSETKEQPVAAPSYLDPLYDFVGEIVRSPVNLALVGLIALLVYKIYKTRNQRYEPAPPVKELPKIRRDFTVEELKPYNGTGPDGRILVAVNGNVFDVTKGARYYGPGGPYSAFGGRDASRGLATFSIDPGKDAYDDLSDLNSDEMNSVREWEEQFKERYDYVGKLLKPGEPHTNYADEEEEDSQQESELKTDAEKKDE